jgi:hypothetical protein
MFAGAELHRRGSCRLCVASFDGCALEHGRAASSTPSTCCSRRAGYSPRPAAAGVCFDERPIQLIGEARRPIPSAQGRIERHDCEYRRNNTANLFVFLDANRRWRKAKVTPRRAAEDFATCMRDLTDVHYPGADRIRRPRL